MKKGYLKKIAIIILCILLATMVSIYFLFSQIFRYKQEIAHAISEQIGLPVEINSMKVFWLGFHPTFLLENVEIISPTQKNSTIHIEKIQASIRMLTSLHQRKITFNNLELAGSHLTIEQTLNGDVYINGIRLNNNNKGAFNLNNINFKVGNIDFILHDANNNTIVLHNLTIIHTSNRAQITANNIEIHSKYLNKPILFDNISAHLNIDQTNSNLNLKINDLLIKYNLLNITGDGNIELKSNSISNLSFNIHNPFNLNLNAAFENQKGNINFSLDSNISTSTLKQIYNLNNIEKYASGNTHFKLQGNIFKKEMEYDYTLKLNSNLEGLQINLFHPLNKAMNQSIPLNLEINKNDGIMKVLLNYQQKLSANLLAINTKNQWQLDAGNIYIGNGTTAAPTTKGISIRGKIPNLDVMDLISYLPEKNNNSTFSFPINHIQLNFDNLLLAKYPLNNTQITARLLKNNWLINIRSRTFVGNLKIQDSTKPIYLTVNHLYLTSKFLHSSNSNAAIKINPKQIPSLNIYCKRLFYDAHNLGTLLLKTNTRQNTLIIKKMNVSNQNVNLNIRGFWRKNGVEKTVLIGDATAKNFGDFLKDWKITEDLSGAKGTMHFEFNWAGPVYYLPIRQLNGKIYFSLEDGVILNVLNNNTELLGNIFNMLSINSLEFLFAKPFSFIAPKRQGFDFDVEKANFLINHGILETNDFYLHGKLAEVEAYGKIDLNHRLYHMNLEITPFVTSYLPMNLALATGPIMLGIVWASDKLIGGIFNRLFRQYYYVNGPWAHPQYQKLKNNPRKTENKKINRHCYCHRPANQ